MVPFEVVANQFLTLSFQNGRLFDRAALVKLAIFAHGWHLAYTGKPLLSEAVEHWTMADGSKLPMLNRVMPPYPFTLNSEGFVVRLLPEPTDAKELTRYAVKLIERLHQRVRPLDNVGIVAWVNTFFDEVPLSPHGIYANDAIERYFKTYF